MSKNIVYQGQNLLNKAVECTGSVENVFELALLNNFNVTDLLDVGTEIKPVAATNKSVLNFFHENNRPASNYNLDIVFVDPKYQFPQGEFPISL